MLFVGSCSFVIKSSLNRLYIDIFFSDVELCYRTGYEEGRCGFFLKKRYVFRIYRLELDIYRGILEVLYVFGFLSWELEIYLIDFRV